MYNLSLSQDPAISREQLREQIRQQVQQATADARQAAQAARQAAQQAAQTGALPAQPGAPVGTPVISIRGGPPGEMDIPPRVKDVSIAFFITMAFVIVGFPLMRAIARRIERGTPPAAQIPPQMQAQMQQLMQSVDAIAIEVERISEGQRFATKMLAEKNPQT